MAELEAAIRLLLRSYCDKSDLKLQTSSSPSTSCFDPKAEKFDAFEEKRGTYLCQVCQQHVIICYIVQETQNMHVQASSGNPDNRGKLPLIKPSIMGHFVKLTMECLGSEIT